MHSFYHDSQPEARRGRTKGVGWGTEWAHKARNTKFIKILDLDAILAYFFWQPQVPLCKWVPGNDRGSNSLRSIQRGQAKIANVWTRGRIVLCCMDLARRVSYWGKNVFENRWEKQT